MRGGGREAKAAEARDVSELDAVPAPQRAARAADLVGELLAAGRDQELAAWMRKADVGGLGAESVVVALGATRDHAGRLGGAHEALLGRLCFALGAKLPPADAAEIVARLTPKAAGHESEEPTR